MASKIKCVRAREVFDTRNIPALEVDVILEDGSLGRAIAPSGTSRGANESVDLRDNDQSYFKGMGVWKAIKNVETLIDEVLRGNDAIDQEHIDRLMIELDGTRNKSKLGGNAMIATSIANAKAAAESLNIPLFEHLGKGKEIPLSWFLVMIGGPIYAGEGFKTSDIQEFAYYALNSKSYREGYTMTLDVYQALRKTLEKKGYALPRLGGGWLAPLFSSNDEALSTMTKAIEEAGYSPGKDFAIYLDVASTHFYKNGMYHLEADNKTLTSQEMVDFLEDVCNAYPIISIEDGLSEEDWEGWKFLTKKIGHRTQLVGDDIFATSPQRLRKAIDMGVANAIIIKPNQIGTVTEAIETVNLAKAAGYGTILSARSGEIGDPFLSHFVVGQSIGQGKLTSFDGDEHIRLNEILRIEEYLGQRGTYAGRKVLSRFMS